MIKQIFIIVLLLCCNGSIHAQYQEEDSISATTHIIRDEEVIEEVVVPVDTILKVRELVISPDSATAWKNRSEFEYIHSLDSLLQASQQTKSKPAKRGSDNSASSEFLGGGFIKFFLWTLALLFVIFIIYQLSTTGRLFTTAKRDPQVIETPDEAELLLQHNFDSLIASAIANQDYRLATRYHFLKLLQQLRDKNYIAYEPDKTNSRYVRELPPAIQQAFSNIVLKYEFIWYGHYDIAMEQFRAMEDDVKTLSQKL